jgi:hypothetical protein
MDHSEVPLLPGAAEASGTGALEAERKKRRDLAIPTHQFGEFGIHKFFHFQGRSPVRGFFQTQGALGTIIHAHPATHTFLFINHGRTIFYYYGLKLTVAHAKTAPDAQILIRAADITGGSQHGHPVSLGLHGPAAAGAAIAYGVETAQHGLLEKGMVYVSAFVLGPEYIQGLLVSNPFGPAGMVLDNKIGKRLAYDQADIQWITRVFAGGAAGTAQNRDRPGILEHYIPGGCVWNNLFHIPYINIPIHADKLLRPVQRNYLAVVTVRKGLFGPILFLGKVLVPQAKPAAQPVEKRIQEFGQAMFPGGHGYIDIRPAAVNISMQPLRKGQVLFFRLPPKRAGGRPEKPFPESKKIGHFPYSPVFS